MPSDPSEVDAAIVATLSGDATLMALLTDGVFVDVSPSGKTAFALVSLISHEDLYIFNGSAFERSIYLIKAVVQSGTGTTAKTAAARIHALLQDVALTITGYAHALTRRVERVRMTEVDDLNQDLRWQHRGGRYELMVSP